MTRSSAPDPVSSSSTGVIGKVCIYCMKKEKKHKNTKQKLNAAATKNFEEKIRKYAHWLDDQPMLLRIGSGDFVSKEIFYHGICRVNYQNKAEKTSQAMEGE